MIRDYLFKNLVPIIIIGVIILGLGGANGVQSCSRKSLEKEITKLQKEVEVLEHNNAYLDAQYERAKNVFELLLGKLEAIQNERVIHINLLEELEKDEETNKYLTCPIPDDLVDWLHRLHSGKNSLPTVSSTKSTNNALRITD